MSSPDVFCCVYILLQFDRTSAVAIYQGQHFNFVAVCSVAVPKCGKREGMVLESWNGSGILLLELE